MGLACLAAAGRYGGIEFHIAGLCVKESGVEGKEGTRQK
jgi:hypothetical protein